MGYYLRRGVGWVSDERREKVGCWRREEGRLYM